MNVPESDARDSSFFFFVSRCRIADVLSRAQFSINYDHLHSNMRCERSRSHIYIYVVQTGDLVVTPAERLWSHWRRWVDLETTGQGLHRMDGKMGLDPSVDSSGALRWERPSALMFLVPGLYIYILSMWSFSTNIR